MRSECGICLGIMLRDNVWLISDRIGLCEAELLSLAQDGLIFFDGQSEVGSHKGAFSSLKTVT